MEQNSWIPKGQLLTNGLKAKKLLYCGEYCQIISVTEDRLALIANNQIYQKWIDTGIVDNNFVLYNVNGENFRLFISEANSVIAPVKSGKCPYTYFEALQFISALKNTRKIVDNISLGDAIYVEQLSVLLPQYSSDSEYIDDSTVLGTWLSGGVAISTKDIKRLSQLTGWLSKQQLIDIISKTNTDSCTNNNLLYKDTVDKKTIKISATKNNKLLSTNERNDKFELAGRPELEAFFNDNIVDIIFHEEKYKKLGIEFPAATILYGPPGCGKTYAVNKLAEFIGWTSFSIDATNIASSYVHETSKKISDVFNQAIESAPSIIIIDEMEAFLSNRSMGATSGLHHVEEVAEFLRRIPEVISKKVLIFGMTNMIDMIDPAILRTGRFDHCIEVTMPLKSDVVALLQHLFKNLPISNDIDIESVANQLINRPLSDVSFVVREAGRISAKNDKSIIDGSSITEALLFISKKAEKAKRNIGFSADND